MSFLLRTSSGKFNLENGITLEELKEYNDNNTLDKYLYDIDYVLTNFNKIKIHENAEKILYKWWYHRREKIYRKRL